MPEETVNPYAPPTQDVSGVPAEARLWCVVDGYLAVRDGAFLPPVDLEGDGRGDHLTPVVRQCSVSFRRVSGTPAAVRFRGYTSVASFRGRGTRTKVRNWMSGIGLFGLIGGIFLNDAGSEAILGEAFAVDGLSIALIFGSAVWQMLDSGVRCRGTRDGWFYLKGISPASLAQFAARSEEAPVPRLRKVYRFYEHRLPLTVLLRNYWYNPWAVIFLAVLKARRSSALESLLLHHGEATGKPWSQGDPQLMEQWESETRGTEMESWTGVGAAAICPPSGFSKLELLTYASPDRKFFATLMVNRVSNRALFREIRQAVIRSWTEGQCIQTCTPPCLPVCPPQIDRRKMKGNLPRLLAGHRAHAGERVLRPVAEGEELASLLAEEAGHETASLSAAGWLGPLETMEIPEYPVRWGPPPFPAGAGRDYSPTAATR